MTTPSDTTIALVTGANKGIGFEVARRLGQQGATVLVGARDGERGEVAAHALRGEGLPATAVVLDVTDEASVASAARQLDRAHGRLDVLVNNAGITGAADTWLPSATSPAVLREVYETNVIGVVRVTNALLPLLRRSGAARIVNVSSEVGSIAAMTDPDGPMAGMLGLAYPSSKTALNMVTALYAKELREVGIKVNAANPGYCATDLNGHSGFRTAAEGAEPIVALATVPADGPTGTFSGYLWRPVPAGAGPAVAEYGPLPW